MRVSMMALLALPSLVDSQSPAVVEFTAVVTAEGGTADFKWTEGEDVGAAAAAFCGEHVAEEHRAACAPAIAAQVENELKVRKQLAGLPALELLVLHRNRIGDHGAMELVGAAAGGAGGGRRRLPSLTELHLSANRLGADAAVALASALDGGAFPALARLYVGGNQMPTRALDALVGAAARRRVDLPHLWRL